MRLYTFMADGQQHLGAFFFAKMPSTVIGPGTPILHPLHFGQVDYEIELAVVIGRTMASIAEPEVMSHLFGYTILHDVSCREVQFKNQQITLGKNFDGFCPIGLPGHCCKMFRLTSARAKSSV